MKRKILLPVLLILLFPNTILNAQTAQVIHEPNSEIYKDIDRWYVQGYIREFLPLIRPYPAALIEKVLDQVMDNGDAAAQQKAASYQEYLSPPNRFIHLGVTAYMQGKNSEKGFLGGPFAEGSVRIAGLLSASFHLAGYGMTDVDGERFNVPGTYTPYSDFINDTSSFGKLELRPQWTSLLAVGTDDTYFQAGLARTSVGPFYDNSTVVGPQAPRAGHFSLVFYRPKWSYEVLFQSITATDDFGEGKFADKYNVIHAISFRPIQNLELGFIQAIVFGQRFEPMYLVPFNYIFASQSLSGFDDNAFMGLHLRWRPFDTFLLQGQTYIDDFNFNGLFEGLFKDKLAVEAGLSWTPKRSFLSKLDFDYTAVFPYCYTHWHRPDEERYMPGKPNYLNYTHLGRNIGPDLEPNSDRFSIRTYWNPVPGIDISLAAYLTRHGNASEGLNTSRPAPDGSIFDDGVDDSGFDYNDPYNPSNSMKHNPRMNLFLLKQETLDIRLGGGIGLVWTVPLPVGILKLAGEYGLQYGWNRGIIKGDNGLDHYWSIGGIWTW